MAFDNLDANHEGTVSCEDFCDFATTVGSLGNISSIQVAAYATTTVGVLQLKEFKQLMVRVLAENVGHTKLWPPFLVEHFLTKRQASTFHLEQSNVVSR